MSQAHAKQDKQSYLLEARVESPEDAAAAELYALENPGISVLLDYQTEFVRRGATERRQDNGLPESSSLVGGGTEYVDQNSYGLITSGGCWQDFQEELVAEVEQIEDGAYLANKDIFLDNGGPMEQHPKIIGMAARIGLSQYPNLYGAAWREGPATDTTIEMIDQDQVEATSEDYEQLSHNLAGESLWEQLTDNAAQKTATELLEETQTGLEDHAVEATHDPVSCVVEYRPTDTKPAVNWPPGNQLKK